MHAVGTLTSRKALESSFPHFDKLMLRPAHASTGSCFDGLSRTKNFNDSKRGPFVPSVAKGEPRVFQQLVKGSRFIAALILTLWVVGCSAAPALAAVTWDLVTYYPATHYNAISMKEFAEEVNKRTKGQVRIRVRAAGELPISPPEVARAVGEGRAPLGDAYAEFVAGDVPISDLMVLPLLATTREEVEKGMPVIEPLIEKQLDRLGAELLFWYIAGAKFEIWGRGEAPRKLEDFKGRKIRALGPISAKFVRQLGGVPVTVAAPEVTTAVQRGVIGAFIASAPFAVGFKWDELINWGWNIDVQLGAPSMIIISKAALAQLTPETANTIRQIGREMAPKFSDRTLSLDMPARERMKKRGITILTPSKEDVEQVRKLVTPLWDEWAQSKGPESVAALKEVRKKLDR